jgi:hypothetical protein
MKHCIACGSHLLEPFYTPGPQPLAALNLPRTEEEAFNALSYPMNFHRCNQCGHIFNVDFDVAMVPYVGDSNLMYNSGSGWGAHIKGVARRLQSNYEISGKTIIDIGAGDGLFLRQLKETDSRNRCIAFEPGVEAQSCIAADLETVVDYFIPERDIQRYKPNVLICRHVLEHMEQPREFVAELAYYGRETRPLFMVEVPCIDKAVREGRFADYLYEHVSHFAKTSLLAMFESTGWFTTDLYTTYNDEVLVWVGCPGLESFVLPPPVLPDPCNVEALLRFLLTTKSDAAFWGGTGKGAAFLNACSLSSYRVIDSDVRKAGRYVPGMGQLIEAPSSLRLKPVETVIITTRWRAADIYAEIKRDWPCVKEIFIVDNDAIRQYTEADYVAEKAN